MSTTTATTNIEVGKMKILGESFMNKISKYVQKEVSQKFKIVNPLNRAEWMKGNLFVFENYYSFSRYSLVRDDIGVSSNGGSVRRKRENRNYDLLWAFGIKDPYFNARNDEYIRNEFFWIYADLVGSTEFCGGFSEDELWLLSKEDGSLWIPDHSTNTAALQGKWVNLGKFNFEDPTFLGKLIEKSFPKAG